MKKTLNYFTIIISIVLLASCSKDSDIKNDTSDNSLFNSAKKQISSYYQENVKTDGTILLMNDYMQTKYNRTSYGFSFQGKFSGETSYSEISFNSYIVPIVENNAYSTSDIDSVNLGGKLFDFFGAKNLIKIDNNVFIEDFYIPKPVVVSFPESSDFTFSKEQGISIDLDVDINNVNPIVVVLEYVDDKATAGSICLTKTYILDSQDRRFLIPEGDLVNFPIGEKLMLYVGCGNGNIVTYDNFVYDLEGINITYFPGIKLY